MPGVSFKLAKERICILDVLSLLQWKQHSVSPDGIYRGNCPFHVSCSGRPRYFAVDPARGKWYCHKCKRNGDTIRLWAELHALDAYQAVLDLCDALHLPVPYLR